jgi:hypothetical protein
MEEPAVDMNDTQNLVNDDAPDVAEVLLIDHGSDPQEPNVLEIVPEEQEEEEETKVTEEEQEQENELMEEQKELTEEQEEEARIEQEEQVREGQEKEREEEEREEQEREEQEEVREEQEDEREEQEEDVTDEQETLDLEPLSKRLARKLPADFQDSNRTPSPAASFTRERLRAARLRRIQQGQLVKT